MPYRRKERSWGGRRSIRSWPTRRRVSALGAAVLAALCFFLLWPRVEEPNEATRAPGIRSTIVEHPATTVAIHRERERVVVEREKTAAEPPPSETSADPPPTAAEFVDVVVRDLWDERPVPEFTVVFSSETPIPLLRAMGAKQLESVDNWSLQTDEHGHISVAVSEDGRTPIAFRPFDTDWSIATVDSSDSSVSPVAWVYATMRVRGRIVADAPDGPPLEMSRVKLQALALGTDRYDNDVNVTGRSIDHRWLRDHNLFRVADLPSVSQDGTFTFEMRRLRSVQLHATVEAQAPAAQSGWRVATALIDDAMCASRVADVTLVFRRGYRIAGTLVDDDGNAVRNASVVIHVLQRVTDDEMRLSSVYKSGTGFTALGDPKNQCWHVDFQTSAESDGDGRFEAFVNVDGDASVHVVPSTKHRTTTIDVGAVTRVEAGREFLVPSERSGDVVEFVDANGFPFKDKDVVLNDVTRSPLQVNVLQRLDSDGRLPARLLVPGNRYFIYVRSPGSLVPIAKARIEWNGESEIVVAGQK